MIGSHNILSKTDRALAAYLISAGAGTSADVYPAKRAEDKVLPDTVCFSSKARLATPHSAVYVVTTMVTVRTNPSVNVNESAEEKTGSSDERVSATFDAFWADVDSSSNKLADAITQAARASGELDLAEFTVQDCTVETMVAGYDERDNAWTDTIELELVVCPKNVS